MTRLMNCVAATLVGAVVMSVTPALAQETRAATTTTAATTVPSAEAKQLIESVKQAYSQLKSLKMAGQMAADIDIAGKVQKRDTSFSAEYESPNLYRHSVKDEIVAGSTGKKVYVLELKRNVYVTDDAPQSKVGYRQLPEVIGEVLEVQDPGLLLAVSANSISDLLEGATKIQKAADTTVDQQTLPTLSYTASDGREISLAFDPQSHLLRQAVYNMSGLMRSRGAEQVNRALITIQYNQLEANGKLDASQFAWTPPANAREVSADTGDEGGTAQLQGKPAPDFTLTGLDGKQVTLSSLKGSTVLLDFWATWCPPCVRSLPEINQIYKSRKDAGVKVFAVNVGEDKAKIQAFLDQKKLDLPVLMDADEQTAGKFQIHGIPTTIVIKADGTVQKVFVGIAPGGRAEIEKELDAAK